MYLAAVSLIADLKQQLDTGISQRRKPHSPSVEYLHHVRSDLRDLIQQLRKAARTVDDEHLEDNVTTLFHHYPLKDQSEQVSVDISAA